MSAPNKAINLLTAIPTIVSFSFVLACSASGLRIAIANY
jgi:hypothetical protein